MYRNDSDNLCAELTGAATAANLWVESLSVGDVFTGAGPAAIAAGYVRGTPGYTAFVSMALYYLDSYSIRVTREDNRIVSLHDRLDIAAA
jgi:hypothetical protein